VNLVRLAFRLLLGRRLPLTRGSLTVPGLAGPVRIHRDRWGIPMIDADDPADGAFALGFCQGQDRAFQLELLLRVARGTVSELVGPLGLPVDRLSRRIGFHRAARQQLPLLVPDIREAIDRFALGVRAGYALGCPRRPHEFVLLGTGPTPWTAVDILAITKVLSFTLCSNWDAELARLQVLLADGPEALRALDAPYPSWQPVTVPVGAKAGPAIDQLAGDLAAFFQWARPGGGSNNWVLAGSRTTTGRPILANDPHLDASLPAHWYLVRLRTPRECIAGACFVGGPVVLVGHNGHACWGLTAGMVDNTDLFLEEIGPDNASIRQGDQFVPCPVREEVIAVKGGPAVTERVLITPRGPIVSPALADTPQALSLRATWLDAAPIEGFFRLGEVRTFAAFRRAFAHWPVSPQNLVYADASGTIGYQMAGTAPVRRQGHGILPLPGWAPDAGWHDEPVPFEQMPHAEGPATGYFATANNRPVPHDRGPFLGVDFLDGYRVATIDRALAARHDWDVAATMRLQMDQHALAWEEMRDAVLGAPIAPDTRALLGSWDGDVGASSPAAAVYELFLVEMVQRVVRAKAPNSLHWLIGPGLSPITPYNFGCFRRTGHLVQLLREQPPGWFSRPWPEEIADAIARAASQAGSRAWGELRPVVLYHPLSRRPGRMGKALGAVFNLGPIPCGGDCDVINQAASLPLAPLISPDNIASLRAVFDVGAWHNSRFVLPGGQSGNPLSPHYSDQLNLWQRGDGVPIAFTPDEVREATVQTLQLRPG
jgi:penicillin amidase